MRWTMGLIGRQRPGRHRAGGRAANRAAVGQVAVRGAKGRIAGRRSPAGEPVPATLVEELATSTPTPSREDGRVTAAEFDTLTRQLVRL
jgi:hypothetical protein